jgi:methionyl-tRNA synthetase
MAYETFYITTPIYYPSGEPHLGHAYTTICADAIARFHRLKGDDTFFLTGTDEHGQKMVSEAAKAGLEPADLAERMMSKFRGYFDEIGITYDDFIRTSERRHRESVQEIVRRMEAAGDIYLGSYSGWYDVGQEEFVTETEAKANEYKSAISGKHLTRYEEKSYFFRLTKYVEPLIRHIETDPDFIQPEARRNKVLTDLKAGVSDLSISRASLAWGVPMPSDPKHVVYVWIDALSNYITALGFGSEDESRYRRYWPGVHLIGKEILWFHTVYWPAMLMSLGEPLPRSVFAHGWWISEGRKMSKSLGNFIGLDELRRITGYYGLDALRYYVLRAAPFGSDLDFQFDELHKSYLELANVLGNGLNRVLRMTGKYRGGVLGDASVGTTDQDRPLADQGARLVGELERAWLELRLQDAVTLPLELARTMNAYIDSTEPFKLAKDESQAARLDAVLSHATTALYRALVALLPVLPERATAGLRQLGVDPAGRRLEDLLVNPPGPGHRLGEGEPLFPRMDPLPATPEAP